jgi:hypothetical protein
MGLAGAALPDPLVVRVTDGHGRGLGLILVEWEVIEGGGYLCYVAAPWGCPGSLTTVTDAEGIAGAGAHVTRLGRTRIRAGISGLDAAAVIFTVGADGVLIRLGPLFDCSDNDPPFFSGPEGRDVSVPVGTQIEWHFLDDNCYRARIVSTEVPSGGSAFDSGDLEPGARFHYVPRVPGTWRFADLGSGAQGSLTAR